MSPWLTWILAAVMAAGTFLLGYCANNPPPIEEPQETESPAPEEAAFTGNKWLGENSGIFLEQGGP